ncbi:segregation/condensation protein A [Mycoplasma corogypsi]|uniref:segregation/condensation protein A n=1 Tax=Mycoplasma corogypsi TaxID=2106 RepID=UPI003873296E
MSLKPSKTKHLTSQIFKNPFKEHTTYVSNEYTFKLKDFDGPLDLLLSLVKDKKINILDINLLEIATQYLDIIHQLKEDEVDIAGEYLVMATTLLKLKTNMLLKDPSEMDQEIEEVKQKLISDLVEYQQFKEIRDTLKSLELERQDIFIKKPSNIDEFIVDTTDERLDGHSNPTKLIMVLRKMFERVYAQRLRQTKIESFKVTPADQIVIIKKLLRENDRLTFEQVFTVPSIKHFVVTLLAILDLSRQQFIHIHQDEQFGEILITKGEGYHEK